MKKEHKIISPLSKEITNKKSEETLDMIEKRILFFESYFGRAINVCEHGGVHLDVPIFLLCLADYLIDLDEEN
jgi:hypothetical protein